jgi:predicted DNA binding CopG/RHH family protein
MSDYPKKQLPAFASEAEEAQWWFDNREQHGKEFAQAIRDGRVTRGGMARRGLIRTHSIDLDPEDFSQAQILAEKKGLRYQTYLRMLIHEALEREALSANAGQ